MIIRFTAVLYSTAQSTDGGKCLTVGFKSLQTQDNLRTPSCANSIWPSGCRCGLSCSPPAPMANAKGHSSQAVALIAPAAIIAITAVEKATTIITTTTHHHHHRGHRDGRYDGGRGLPGGAAGVKGTPGEKLVEGSSNRISTVLMTQTKTPSFCVNKFGHRHEQSLQDDLTSLFFVLHVELSDQEHLFYVRICYFGQRSLERSRKVLCGFRIRSAATQKN